jgi:hypothetical protein
MGLEGASGAAVAAAAETYLDLSPRLALGLLIGTRRCLLQCGLLVGERRGGFCLGLPQPAPPATRTYAVSRVGRYWPVIVGHRRLLASPTVAHRKQLDDGGAV